MNELEIIVKLKTEKKISEEQKQVILGDVRKKVGEYLLDTKINFTEFRVFKTITNEDIADAILK